MPLTNAAAHAFVIQDERLFNGPFQTDLRGLECAICGLHPGQGVHVPPPPPVHKVIAEAVAKRLAETSELDTWQALLPTGASAAFTTIQQVRALLDEMGKCDIYSDPHDMGNPFGDIDATLNELLTELRKLGWD